jgi:DNA modification methylase
MSKQASDLRVIYRDPAELIPYARNARTHSPEQIAKLAASIKEFGFTTPVELDGENGILSGHGRVLAAQKLGLKRIPTIDLSGLTEAQRRAYILAANRLALDAGWDEELLAIELSDLSGLDVDLSVTGFTDEEIEEALQSDGLTADDEDAADEIPEADPAAAVKTKPGDVWVLGNHRLICGDSTSAETFERLLHGKKADLTFTSPPYNADTKAGDGDIFNKKPSKKLYTEGYTDNLESSEYIAFASSVLDMAFAHTDGFVFWNVSYNGNSRYEYIAQIQRHLQQLIEQICWRKTSCIPFKGSLMREWEPIYLFSTNGERLGLDEVVSNFWQINNTGCQTDEHKACYPVALPEKGISLIKPKSGIVLDPFLGSGTTMIAAEKAGRACYGVELDPRYCDLIIRRWQEFTGKQAVRESDGRLFDEI